MNLLEEAWEQREKIVYRDIFGSMENNIYPLDSSIFLDKYAQDSFDPRWLFYGVFRIPPNEKRDTWVYVTSGMSNPWETDDVKKYSGLGMEFLLESKDGGDWGITTLHEMMAYNILISVGKYGDIPLLDYGDKISLQNREGIKKIILSEPMDYRNTFELKSGEVDLIQLIGIHDNGDLVHIL